MPTFQEYLDSIKDPKQHQQIRLKLIGDIEAHTNRKLIVYAADFQKSQRAQVIIDQTDKSGFSDLIEGIQGSLLDVIIHSPGGFAEAMNKGLNIYDMRQDSTLRDLVWRLYCCVELFFDRSPVYKLFENNYGVSFARNVREIVVPVPLMQFPPPPQAPGQPKPTP